LDSGSASLVFSGDTTTNDELWNVVNRIENLRYLLIETAFSEGEKEIAILSKHYCPSLLAEDLLKFRGDAEVHITHLKPGEVELTMRQIEKAVHGRHPRMLLNNQEFEF
jgi:ribonuclease BN (tRNA processing enzyme)